MTSSRCRKIRGVKSTAVLIAVVNLVIVGTGSTERRINLPLESGQATITGEVHEGTLAKRDFQMLDFLEPHIWMASFNGQEFYKEVGYDYPRFDYSGYRNMALHGKRVYDEKKAYWQQGLTDQIHLAAEWSRQEKQALITTECWGVVDYKDHPLLDWDYVKELCALGTEEAAKTGVTITNCSQNDPIVLLKHFGPGNPDLVLE